MRPRKIRNVQCCPQATVFKPRGIPACSLQRVELGPDELEALRLADLEGLHQQEAGQRMGVSRATFGRIVEAARRKVALALLEGRAIIMLSQHGHE